MLTLLVISMLTLAFDIQPIKAVPTTWTVDDDGPADFSSIQEAINAASSGDTIYVYNGTYYENVVLNKTVSLIGENREKTIIDGSGIAEAIAIIVNNTNLDSFTIQSSSKTAILLENVSGTAIVSNTITNSVNGLTLGFSNHNTIVGNNITQNMFTSNFVNSSHNILTDNTINGLYISKCFNNTLANNTMGSFTISYSPSNKLGNNSIWTFGVYGNMYSHFVQNIDSSNTVNTKPIYYWINRENDEVPSDAGYVALINSTNITVGNLNLENRFQSILLFSTKNSLIHSNNLIDINHGIWLLWSSNNTISENSITDGLEGIHFEYSSNNIVSGNTITDNSKGIRLTKSSSNVFCHNNFIGNQKQVYLYESFDNVWDDGYPSGGNCWSDYAGVDEKSGTNQDEPTSDGIGDTPYIIDGDNQDNYPLMEPWTPAPPTVISVYPPTRTALIGETFTVNITITDVSNLYFWEFFMNFSSTVLNVTSVTEGPFLSDVDQTSWSMAPPYIDNTAGIVKAFSLLWLYPAEGASGNGTLCTITFQVKDLGNTTLHFYYTLLFTYVDPDPILIEHTVEDGYFSNSPSAITATIDVKPDTLNLKSQGKWIAAHIKLPEGYNVEDIDVSTIMLNDVLPAESSQVYRRTLMVKFDRSEEIALLPQVGEAELTIAGKLFDGTSFEGSDSIRVILPPVGCGGGGRRRKT